MEVHRETGMRPITMKMTEIRRSRKAPILHNYYLNCEQASEIFALYGQDTVVFWSDDRGICRVYFYSGNPDELARLLSRAPEGGIMDYLTYTKDELRELLGAAGWELRFEMHRMTTKKRSPEKEAALRKKLEHLDTVVYMPDNVREATAADCDEIYRKLFEVFDPRESHLCTKEELLEYIQNRWVTVYSEGDRMMGFYIFKIEKKRFYGYQIWNGTGPEGYYSLVRCSDRRYKELVGGSPGTRPGYSWINTKNTNAVRLSGFWGQTFDGLYDFVYEKIARAG